MVCEGKPKICVYILTTCLWQQNENHESARVKSCMQGIPDLHHTNESVDKGLEMLESVCIVCLSHLETESACLGDASFLLQGGT